MSLLCVFIFVIFGPKKGHDYKTFMSMTRHSDIKSLMKYVSVDDGRIEVGRNLYSNSDEISSFCPINYLSIDTIGIILCGL